MSTLPRVDERFILALRVSGLEYSCRAHDLTSKFETRDEADWMGRFFMNGMDDMQEMMGKMMSNVMPRMMV